MLDKRAFFVDKVEIAKYATFYFLLPAKVRAVFNIQNKDVIHVEIYAHEAKEKEPEQPPETPIHEEITGFQDIKEVSTSS